MHAIISNYSNSISICISSCSDLTGYNYYHDKECYISCPGTYPFIYNTNNCVDSCPNNMYVGLDNVCTDSCSTNRYTVIDGISYCVQECEYSVSKTLANGTTECL